MSNENNLELSSKMLDFVHANNFEDVKISSDEAKGIATITGKKDGIQYTTTMKMEPYGCVQTSAQFQSNMDKNQKIEQIKSLLKQGYTQNEIATMLGISQSLVSKYKNL